MTQPPDRLIVLQRLRASLTHDPKPSPLVQALADYILERDPLKKRTISRRFYTRLNQVTRP